jgi:hypothetical protein
MDILSFSLWFPNFATKYKFYFESGIIPQPFTAKFWKMFYNKSKREAIKENLEVSEEIDGDDEEETLSYFYKDPSSLCEMKIKSTKVYENKVEIKIR